MKEDEETVIDSLRSLIRESIDSCGYFLPLTQLIPACTLAKIIREGSFISSFFFSFHFFLSLPLENFNRVKEVIELYLQPNAISKGQDVIEIMLWILSILRQKPTKIEHSNFFQLMNKAIRMPANEILTSKDWLQISNI